MQEQLYVITIFPVHKTSPGKCCQHCT